MTDLFYFRGNQRDDLQLTPEFWRFKKFSEITKRNLDCGFDRLVFESTPISENQDPFMHRIPIRIRQADLAQCRLPEGRAEGGKCFELLIKRGTLSPGQQPSRILNN